MKQTFAPFPFSLFPSFDLSSARVATGTQLGLGEDKTARQVRGQKRSRPFVTCIASLRRPKDVSHKRLKDSSLCSQENTEASRVTPVALLECGESLELEGRASLWRESKGKGNRESEGGTLEHLDSRENTYFPDPFYFEKYQPNLYWTMRLILLDWLMEVSAEFQLKRETFHYSVNYIDRFLSLSPGLSKSNLQLLGTAALLLASKMEEVFMPKLRDFVRTTDNGYDISQLESMELLLARTLGWQLAPPTLNMWASWCMHKWDAFIQSNAYATVWLRTSFASSHAVFKVRSQESYSRFRELMQVVDVALLDVGTLKYKCKTIASSALYLVLALHYRHANVEEIVNQFPYESFFINPHFPFNELFGDFLKEYLDLGLDELLPAVQHMAGFLALEFDCRAPPKRHITEV